MGLKLKRKKYNSKIQIYYQDEVNYGLAEELMDYVWSNKGLKQHKENFELIKDDVKKGKVYRMKFDDQVYYVKCYAHRKLKKVIKNIFRPVEAVKCFKIGIKLLNADIAVAEPVLGLTCRRSLFLVDSIFVAKEVPGVDLHAYLERNKTYDKELRENIIREMALLWSKLVNHNFLHHDPWLGNFMFDPKQKIIQIKLIDIDNIYSLPFLPQNILIKNLARLRSKQLYEFSKNNNKALTQDEINIFLEEFIQRCHRKLKTDKLQESANFHTIKRLIKHHNQNLILGDNILDKLFKNRFIK